MSATFAVAGGASSPNNAMSCWLGHRHGQNHLAIAIARSCIRSGARGRFFNVVAPQSPRNRDPQRTARTARRASDLNGLHRAELGYLLFTHSGGQLLFHLVSRLYERAYNSWRFKSRDADHDTRARPASAIPASSEWLAPICGRPLSSKPSTHKCRFLATYSVAHARAPRHRVRLPRLTRRISPRLRGGLARIMHSHHRSERGEVLR